MIIRTTSTLMKQLDSCYSNIDRLKIKIRNMQKEPEQGAIVLLFVHYCELYLEDENLSRVMRIAILGAINALYHLISSNINSDMFNKYKHLEKYRLLILEEWDNLFYKDIY